MEVEDAVFVSIEAPLSHVWDTISELGAYPRWSPLVVHVAGQDVITDVEQQSVLDLALPTGRKLRTSQFVYEYAPPHPDALGHVAWMATHNLGWKAEMGLVRAWWTQRLSQPAGRATQYFIEQRVEGMFAGLLPAAALREGFQAHAVALKGLCESTWTRGGTPVVRRAY